ncbi:MAG: hypothetical protein PHN64_08845 [Desulfovibrionaceae bacterium]|nr:hypothetical protein [Desulfovibrionaceae bacterium]
MQCEQAAGRAKEAFGEAQSLIKVYEKNVGGKIFFWICTTAAFSSLLTAILLVWVRYKLR